MNGDSRDDKNPVGRESFSGNPADALEFLNDEERRQVEALATEAQFKKTLKSATEKVFSDENMKKIFAQSIDRIEQEKGPQSDYRQQTFMWGAKVGNALVLEALLDERVDINFQDRHGMTALHYAAAMGARTCIRVLIHSGKCDYLIQDRKDRYASELAFEYARDYAVGVLLSKKEVKQAANKK